MRDVARRLFVGGTSALMIAAMSTGGVTASATPQPATGVAEAPSPAGLHDPSIPTLPEPECLPGQTPLHATAAGKTADGGFVYDFVIAGKMSHLPVPPPTFNPATADDVRLTEYGFPPRPTARAPGSAWSRRFAGIHVPLPALCLVDHANTPAQVPPPGASTVPAIGPPVGPASTLPSQGIGRR